MKAYKIFRWLLKASALTTVMFVMQACYGSPMGMEEMRRVTDERPKQTHCLQRIYNSLALIMRIRSLLMIPSSLN